MQEWLNNELNVEANTVEIEKIGKTEDKTMYL